MTPKKSKPPIGSDDGTPNNTASIHDSESGRQLPSLVLATQTKDIHSASLGFT